MSTTALLHAVAATPAADVLRLADVPFVARFVMPAVDARANRQCLDLRFQLAHAACFTIRVTLLTPTRNRATLKCSIAHVGCSLMCVLSQPESACRLQQGRRMPPRVTWRGDAACIQQLRRRV